MRTASRESWPSRRKKRKNRGGEITRMRPRRSLFFVAPATPAGSTSCKPPAPATRLFRPFTNHATWFFPVPTATPRRATTSPTNEFFTNHESRDTKHGFSAFLAAFLRVVARHGAAMARHGRGRRPPHRQHGLLVFTNHASPHLSPFGSSWVRKGRTTENRRPDRRARRQVTASLFKIVRHCSLLI